MGSEPTPDAPPASVPAAAAPSLEHATVRASIWTIVTGLGTRVLGVVGTLLVTHYIAPYDYGEVSAAAVLVWTAAQFATLNVGTYILAHPKSGRDVMFHATVLHVVPGVVMIAAVWALGWRLGAVFDAPTLGRYLPGILVASLLERLIYMPERVLIRTMRFGPVALSRALGELSYTGVSVATAVLGWGGFAIVAGNVARSGVRFLFLGLGYVPWREWLEVTRLRAAIVRDMLRFCVPVAVGSAAAFGVRRWDNLLVSRFFGPAVLGNYNLAYNLADIPAVQVGEQVSDVLQAAFSRLEGGDPRRALLRSLSILAYVMTPLAIGLACVAQELASAFFDARWAQVGPMLVVLAIISFTRPIGNTIGAYLQVRRRPLLVATVDVLTLGLLMGALWTVGRLGPLWACGVVGLVFLARLLAWAPVLRTIEGVRARDVLGPLVPPVLACLPMIAATQGVYVLARGTHVPAGVVLVAQVLVGALAFLGGSLVVARRQLEGVVGLLRGGLRRRA